MALGDHLELHVYSKDDPNEHLDILQNRIDPQVLEELRGDGGGSFKISTLDPKVVANPSLLDYRNFYRFKVGDRTIGSFIGKVKKTEVVGQDAADELHVISGKGARDWLSDAIVYPQSGLKKSSRTQRSFNFSSQIGSWYKPSDWVNVVNQRNHKAAGWEYRPQGFPNVPGATWVWGQAKDAKGSVPKGKVYFRGTFSVANF